MAPLTNIQQEVWNFVGSRGPGVKLNWSKILTKLDPKRQKGFSAKRIHAAVVKMNEMTPCRMKFTAALKDHGTGLEAL